jgi:glycosyltransferase involved in cell wall biosynthesis
MIPVMKVLLVHNRYRSDSPSGENRVVDQEAAALEAAGNHVERFERFSDDIAGWSRPRQAIVPLRVVWSQEARRDLAAVLRRTKPDVVHIQNTFPLLSPSVLYACRDEQVPAVVTFHNYRQICPSGALFRDGAVCHDCVGHLPLAAVRHGCYRSSPFATAPLALTTLVHRTAWRTLPSAYIFVSKAERDLFAPLGLPADRVFVKENLVPATGSVTVPVEDKVVYVGRLSDTKGIPTLMASWDRYIRDSPEPRLRLVIAGTGPLEATIQDWSRERSGVEVAGLLDREACARLVAGARAVIVPSEWEETFGLVVVEAMAAGVPTIVSGIGALPELVTDGVDGIVLQPGNVAALARVMREVDEEPARFEQLGRRARKTYEDRFDPDANLEELLSIYRFAIDNPIWESSGASQR